MAGCADDPPGELLEDVALALEDYPELATDGGIATVPASVSGYEYTIYVRNDDGLYLAFSPWCSHQGCNVRPSGSGFRCPWHGAEFNRNGRVRSGPARRNMITFDTESTDTTVTVLADS